MIKISSAPYFRTSSRVAFVLSAILFAVYCINGTFLYTTDAEGTLYSTASLVQDGTILITPSKMPNLFFWSVDTSHGKLRGTFTKWDNEYNGKSMRELYRSGILQFVAGSMCITPSVQKTASGETGYVNSYGIGAVLTAAPLFYVLTLIADPLTDYRGLLWYGGKFLCSFLIAASAGILFLILTTYIKTSAAFLFAAAYGVGTCVWSTSSQSLWQHAPATFFLAIGTYCLIVKRGSFRFDVCAGAAFACAVACRPQLFITVPPIVIYLFFADRKSFIGYLAGVIPVAAGLLLYNWHYFGSALDLPFIHSNARVAYVNTGSSDVWQTPLGLGLAGLVVSPSRGLLIFSPFLILSFPGMYMIWRKQEYSAIRPFTLSFICLLLLNAKWFEWWGGFSYGPRLMVDSSLWLVLFMAPTAEWLLARHYRLALFSVLFVWSVFVQVLGAFAYDGYWNSPAGAAVKLKENNEIVYVTLSEGKQLVETGKASDLKPVYLNVDKPQFHYRLWSFRDQEIIFYLLHFRESQERKRQQMIRIMEGYQY